MYHSRKYLLILTFLVLILTKTSPVYADYVLPYPSYMPGNKIYKVTRLIDVLSKWWHWGNIAKVKYYLKLSDKYLVEAKTLYEYKQYLLATDALQRSDSAIREIPSFLSKAKAERIDIHFLQNTVTIAGQGHIRILTELEDKLPEVYTWTPEKSASTDLTILQNIRNAIQIRSTLIEDVNRI